MTRAHVVTLVLVTLGLLAACGPNGSCAIGTAYVCQSGARYGTQCSCVATSGTNAQQR